MVLPVSSLGGAPLFDVTASAIGRGTISLPPAPPPAPNTTSAQSFLSIASLGGRATLAVNALPPPPDGGQSLPEISRTITFESGLSAVQDLTTGTFGIGERIQLARPESAIGATTPNFPAAPELFNISV
ncbi:MAG: hypothetical protein AAF684_00915 [Pseudomonadota bacterium]